MAKKVSSAKQDFARRRNWMKTRIMGMYIDTSVLSENEKAEAMKIKQCLNTMIGFWDAESETKFGINIKPHRCYFCGRRSNVERTIDYEFVPEKKIKCCKKHFNEFKNE